MANPKAQTKSVDVWKKKRWYAVVAPPVFNNAHIGDTPTAEPDDLKGRYVTVNLMVLTGNVKKQSYNVTFEITQLQGDHVLTILRKYEIMPAALKRMVRRGKTRIDDSFATKTKDNVFVRVKPILLTANVVNKAVETEIRKYTKEFILQYVPTAAYDELVNDIVSGKLQKSLREQVNRFYPIVTCEIRALVLEDEAKLKGKIEHARGIQLFRKKEDEEQAERKVDAGAEQQPAENQEPVKEAVQEERQEQQEQHVTVE